MLDPQSDRTSGHAKLSVALIVPSDAARLAAAGIVAGTGARILREFAEYPNESMVQRLADSGCDVVIVDLDAGVGPGLALIETICRRDVSITVMACSGKNDASIVIRAMQAGAREFLTMPLAAVTFAEAFTRAAARRQAVAPERNAGRILVFQSAKGGAGATTLATNFAVALVKEAVGKVVVVDLHPQLGEVALSLGLSPRFSVVDALGNAGRLDADFLATMLVKHESGLMVLGSSDTYGSHRSLEHGAEKLFRILREEFAFVVVDAGSCTGNIPDSLFDAADTIYLVTQVDLPALRNARRLISWFAAKESVRGIEVVLNRFNSRTVEIDEDSTTKALSRPATWKIPNDYMAVRNAQNLGVPLVGHDTPIARVIYRMAKAACGKSGGAADRQAQPAPKGEKWKFWTSSSIKPLSTAGS